MKIKSLTLLLWVFLLASCAAGELPSGAEAALIDTWEGLPGDSHSFKIVRAWPGRFPVEGYPGDGPRLDIWCVEAVSGQATEANEAPMVWIVTRQAGGIKWTAALLMAMSSIWPYQACGVGPISTLPIEAFHREVLYTP